MSQVVPVESLLVEPGLVQDAAFERTLVDVGKNGPGRPILVDPDLQVLYRHDVATACSMLQVREIEVEIIDLQELLAGQNGHHNFTAVEMVAVGRLLERMLQPLAAQNQAEGRARSGAVKAGRPVEKLADCDRVLVRPRVARALGVGESHYGMARNIVKAAEQDPDQFGDLLVLLEGSPVSVVYKEYRRRVALTTPPPPPSVKPKGLTVKFTNGRTSSVVIQNAMYSLQAAADTVADMDLTTVSSTDIASWRDDLYHITRSLMAFRSRLTIVREKEQVG